MSGTDIRCVGPDHTLWINTGTTDPGLFKSIDEGRSWTSQRINLFDVPSEQYVSGFYVTLDGRWSQGGRTHFQKVALISPMICMAATTALLKDHLVETLTSGLQRSVASLESIDLEYVGNNIGVGAGWQ